VNTETNMCPCEIHDQSSRRWKTVVLSLGFCRTSVGFTERNDCPVLRFLEDQCWFYRTKERAESVNKPLMCVQRCRLDLTCLEVISRGDLHKYQNAGKCMVVDLRLRPELGHPGLNRTTSPKQVRVSGHRENDT
jgi:hypothetical protein